MLDAVMRTSMFAGVTWSLVRQESAWLSNIPYIGVASNAGAADDIEMGSIWRRPPQPDAVP